MKIANKDKPAFPNKLYDNRTMNGMTKREYFAGLAMQGLVRSTIEHGETVETQARVAVEMADALLSQLSKG